MLVADMASKCVARIRRISNQASCPNDGNDFGNEPRLRILWMDFDPPRHARIVATAKAPVSADSMNFSRSEFGILFGPRAVADCYSPMQLLLDYIPIVAFILAYFYRDIFFATAILMAVMPVILLVQLLLTKKLNRIYAASTALVLVLGGFTLVYRNPTFLYWKPTVLNWAFALVFMGSQWFGDKPIVERMLGSAAVLTRNQWLRLNQIWVVFFIFVGAVNLYVFKSFGEDFWVKFKLFGFLGMTLVFVVIQSIWLTMAAQKNESAQSDPEA